MISFLLILTWPPSYSHSHDHSPPPTHTHMTSYSHSHDHSPLPTHSHDLLPTHTHMTTAHLLLALALPLFLPTFNYWLSPSSSVSPGSKLTHLFFWLSPMNISPSLHCLVKALWVFLTCQDEHFLWSSVSPCARVWIVSFYTLCTFLLSFIQSSLPSCKCPYATHLLHSLLWPGYVHLCELRQSPCSAQGELVNTISNGYY